MYPQIQICKLPYPMSWKRIALSLSTYLALGDAQLRRGHPGAHFIAIDRRRQRGARAILDEAVQHLSRPAEQSRHLAGRLHHRFLIAGVVFRGVARPRHGHVGERGGGHVAQRGGHFGLPARFRGGGEVFERARSGG